jgi:hypothetical protein
VADGWYWFVLREKYCWLIAGGRFVLREKYCWLVVLGNSGKPVTLETLSLTKFSKHVFQGAGNS